MSSGRLELEPLLALVPDLEKFRIEERSEVISGEQEVWGRLARLQVRSGWLCVTDEVRIVIGSEDLERRGAPPLDGEILSEDGGSVHLQHLGDDRWRYAIRQRIDDPEGCGTVRRFFVAGDPSWRAVYEVEWRLVPDAFGSPVLRPWIHRFAGLEKEGEE